MKTGFMLTIFNSDQRFVDSYMKAIPGYVYTSIRYSRFSILYCTALYLFHYLFIHCIIRFFWYDTDNILQCCVIIHRFKSDFILLNLDFMLLNLNRYYDTGDAGMVDEDGYLHVMSRTDDVINVAGHRLSTGAIEEVMLYMIYMLLLLVCYLVDQNTVLIIY